MSTEKLALLIDGDNVSSKIIAGLLAEVANYGTASVRRIYGDWTKPNLNSWKECLLEYSIIPIQQFAYTTGKNATDGAMIIDAMDLLYTGRFSGFCLVSSDSDFTRLAARIREQAVPVYGFGERKTPRPFITACDKFVYFDVLTASVGQSVPPAGSTLAGGTSTSSLALRTGRLDATALQLLRNAVRLSVSDAYDGWANLAAVGENLRKQAPDFDARNFGFEKLHDLVKASDIVNIKFMNRDPHARIIVVKLK
jgi:uncharacterized LabA/DUF88 family protein